MWTYTYLHTHLCNDVHVIVIVARENLRLCRKGQFKRRGLFLVPLCLPRLLLPTSVVLPSVAPGALKVKTNFIRHHLPFSPWHLCYSKEAVSSSHGRTGTHRDSETGGGSQFSPDGVAALLGEVDTAPTPNQEAICTWYPLAKENYLSPMESHWVYKLHLRVGFMPWRIVIKWAQWCS